MKYAKLKICEEMQGLHNWVSKKKRTEIFALDNENEIERFETVIRCKNCGYEQLTIDSTFKDDDEWWLVL